MTFLEFKKRTRKTKPKEAGQAPASQASDQNNQSKNAATPDAEVDNDPIVMGVIESLVRD